MATKRVIQAPTINNSWQITGSSGKTFVTTNKFTPGIATSSSWWPTDNGGSYVDYNPTTDLSWNIISWSVWRVNYDSSGRVVTPTRVNIPKTVSSTDKSVSLIASRWWVTNGLISGKSDSLPWVTKYAGQDQTAWGIKYWNNQAGIDFLNSQNKAPMQWVYNPTPPPTVATQRKPVIKKTLPKEEAPVRPDIQSMDLPTIQENIDRLTYKVNSGKNLTEDEYVTFNQLRRQATDMMKPQSLTGGLDNLMQQQQGEITSTQQTQEAQNAKDLESYTKSQDAYLQAQLAELDRAEEENKKTLGYILWAQGAGTSSYGAEAIQKITDNSALQKIAKREEIQAKIDLFWSQQRKDSAETIQKMKDNLYKTQIKASEYDVDNLEAINAYNQQQGKDVMKNLDDLKAMSDGIIASSTPLTEQQKEQASVIWQFLVDPDGWLNQALLESYKKTNPNLIPYALSMAVGERNKIQENKLAMQWLDADIKRAQLNKLLNPDIDRKPTWETDANGNPILYDPKNPTNTAVIPVAPTDIGWLSGADLAKTLASWKIDWKKFFGVYATGDPDGTQFASIYDKAANMWLDAYMKSRQSRGSKITADMVNQASIATGVDPITIAAKMAQDSWMGTQGKGARNNNPWNVWQFDSLDAKWITVKWYNTLEDWVLAVADNFKKRQDALLSVTPQRKQSGDINKIYQILTEAWQADWVAKNNAKTLASSWKTIEQIKQEYPNKDDQYRIRDVTDSVSKAYESFNKSNTKLDWIMRILKDPNASGKSIEVALKSFVSAIDNTAAMAWEVAQARDAWLSDIDALQARLIKIWSWKVKESIRKDIENTISQFHTWIQWAYDDYLDTQQWSIKTQYGDIWADKLNLYKRWWQMQSTNAPKISSDRQ